ARPADDHGDPSRVEHGGDNREDRMVCRQVDARCNAHASERNFRDLHRRHRRSEGVRTDSHRFRPARRHPQSISSGGGWPRNAVLLALAPYATDWKMTTSMPSRASASSMRTERRTRGMNKQPTNDAISGF